MGQSRLHRVHLGRMAASDLPRGALPMKKVGAWVKPTKPSPFGFKMALLRKVFADEGISLRAKAVFTTLLLIHHNTGYGRCNPRREVLAKELGTSIDSIKRGLGELRRAGWIKQQLTRGAPYYSFPHLQLGGADAPP